MECDPTRMCELLVGLGDVDLVGINDGGEGAPLVVVTVPASPVRCVVPVAGRCGPRVSGVWCWWICRRWVCPDSGCGVGSFVEQGPEIAPERGLLTSRAARWATIQVGRRGRPVLDVAKELGEPPRVFRRLLSLRGWRLWEDQIGMRRRCGIVRFGWCPRSETSMTRSGRRSVRSRRSSGVRRRRCVYGCASRSGIRVYALG